MISQNTDATILKDYENEYFAKLLLSWASSPPRPNFLMDGIFALLYQYIIKQTSDEKKEK